MTKVLTGVLSVGLLAAGSGGAIAANNNIDKQDVDNKYFTHTEIQDGKTFYGYGRGDAEYLSDHVLTEEGIEQIKVDNTEPEQVPDVPVDESFNGTVHESGKAPYSYEHEGIEISSERALTQEELGQVKVDNTEPESAPDNIPVDESFKGTISK